MSTFPRDAGGKHQRARSCLAHTPSHPPAPRAPPRKPPRASPCVAAHFQRVSRGILSALVEAGTPFQGHTPVFMPDLQERSPKVLGATVSDQKPCWEHSLGHRPGQGAHTQAEAWQTQAPIYTMRPARPWPSYPAGDRASWDLGEDSLVHVSEPLKCAYP